MAAVVSFRAYRIHGHRVTVYTDDSTGNGRAILARGTRRVYLGELLVQTLDELHPFLSDPTPGVEAWEPERPWPWRQQHYLGADIRDALSWLVRRAHQRGEM